VGSRQAAAHSARPTGNWNSPCAGWTRSIGLVQVRCSPAGALPWSCSVRTSEVRCSGPGDQRAAMHHRQVFDVRRRRGGGGPLRCPREWVARPARSAPFAALLALPPAERRQSWRGPADRHANRAFVCGAAGGSPRPSPVAVERAPPPLPAAMQAKGCSVCGSHHSTSFRNEPKTGRRWVQFGRAGRAAGVNNIRFWVPLDRAQPDQIGLPCNQPHIQRRHHAAA